MERQFEIIGEALSQALRLHPDLSNRFTDYRRIVAFRNRLIHGYAFVSGEVVWGVCPLPPALRPPRLLSTVFALDY